MADILLTLNLEPALVRALDKIAADADVQSRSVLITSLLRDWLVSEGYYQSEEPTRPVQDPVGGASVVR